jgi:hypothetical protein
MKKKFAYSLGVTALALSFLGATQINNQTNAQTSSKCYSIQSLNRNFLLNGRKYLGVNQIRDFQAELGEGATVQAIRYNSLPSLTESKYVWKITTTDNGSIITQQFKNLDGANDGKTVKLVEVRRARSIITHGQYWELQNGEMGGYDIRSLNRNFRDSNYRWLDGGSDGKTVSLVNGKSQSTLWSISTTTCQ